MPDIDQLCEEAMEQIGEIGDDTQLLSAAESLEFYEGVASLCETRAAALREDMRE